MEVFRVSENVHEDMERGSDEERINKYAAKCADMMDYCEVSFYEAAEVVVRDEDFLWEHYADIEETTEMKLNDLQLRAKLGLQDANDDDWRSGFHSFND